MGFVCLFVFFVFLFDWGIKSNMEKAMQKDEDTVKKERLVDARARNISHNVRCTECGSQSIEDSQADVAILLRKVSCFIISFGFSVFH